MGCSAKERYVLPDKINWICKWQEGRLDMALPALADSFNEVGGEV